MFSMEGFCYGHKRLSKFGAPKKPLCFQGGGFEQHQTLTTWLIAGVGEVLFMKLGFVKSN